MTCRHCHRNKPAKGKRGLCMGCYGDRAVRRLYPTDPFRRPDLVAGRPETDTDLDALVAEQMRRLPAWWKRETDEELEAGRPRPLSRLGAAFYRGRELARVARDSHGRIA